MRELLLAAACAVLSSSSVASSGNLLTNPDFEASDTELVGWEGADTKVFRVAKGEGVNGSNALRWESSDTDWHSYPKQTVRLEPGKSYRYSMMVRHEDLDGAVKNSAGVELLLLGLDAQGKQTCGRYAHGMRKTSDGWYELWELLYDVPATTVKATFAVTVAHGLTGRAWFDDLKVEEYVPPVVEGLYSSAYRNCAWGQTVRFAAALNVPADAFRGAKAWLCFTDRWGKPRKFAADALDRETATFDVKTTKFAAGENRLRFALEDASGKELGSAELVFRMLEKRPKEWYTWFDENQVLRVSGRKVFPIGVCFGGKSSKERWSRFMSSGINFMMSYNRLSRAELDSCASNGVLVAYSGGINNIYAGDRNAMMKGIRTYADQYSHVTNRVLPVKDHPAIIGWYLNDETRPVLTEKMKKQQKLLETLDPSRFTYSIFDHPEYVRGYLDCFDVFAMDPYPIGRWPIGQVLEWSERMRRGAIAMRPYWICAQDFDWSWFRMGKSMPSPHMPSLAELSSMVWQAIAAGAKGVTLYGPAHFFEDDHLATSEANFRDMVSLVADLRRLSPAFVSAEDPVRVSGVPPEIRVRTWRLGDDSYLLAVNPTNRPIRTKLKLSEGFATGFPEAGGGLGLSGDGRSIDVDFGPIGFGMIHLAGTQPRLFFAGDSLLAKSEPGGRQRQSWGEELSANLAPGFSIMNFARGGASTRTFRNFGCWDEILCRGKKGDWVVISFGHNDSSLHRPDRGVFVADYRENLGRFVAEARAKGMNPVLVTPVATGTFGKDGRYQDVRNLTAYAEAMKEVAARLSVPVVDLYAATRKAVEGLGAVRSQDLYMVKQDGKDTTHLNAAGARRVAELFLEAANGLKLGFLK